jgi:hypothetical protein
MLTLQAWPLVVAQDAVNNVTELVSLSDSTTDFSSTEMVG